MTISLVGTSSAATGGANLTITLPGGTAADDVAVMLISERLGGGSITAPTGWSTIPGFPFPASPNDGCFGFYKRLVGGDANPQATFSNGSGQGVVGVLAVYRGVHLTLGPFAANAQNTGYGATIGPQTVAAGYEVYANVRILEFLNVLYTSTTATVTTANGFTNQVALGVGTSWPCAATLLDKAVTDGYNGWTGATSSTAFGANDVMMALIDADQPNLFRAVNQSSTATVYNHTQEINCVGVTTAATGGANLAFTLPANTRADDVAVIFISQRLSGGVCGTPSGWTIIPGYPFPTSLNDGTQGFYKRLVGGDANPTSTFSNGSGAGVCGILAVYRGVHATLGPFGANALGQFYGTTVGPYTVPAETSPYAWVGILNPIALLYQNTQPGISNANGFVDRGGTSVGTSWPCGIKLMDKMVCHDGYNAQTGVTATAGFNAWDNMVYLINANQPNLFRGLNQGSAGTQYGMRTEFPEPFLGPVATGGGGGVFCAVPSNLVPGDIMVAVGSISNGTYGFNDPAGWTRVWNLDGSSGSRLTAWKRTFVGGDTGVTLTSSGNNITGRIIGFKGALQYDKQTAVTGSGNVADQTPADLTTIDDVNTYVIAVNSRGTTGTPTTLKSGSEQGFTPLWSWGQGGFGATQWNILAGRQHLGATTQVAPTFTGFAAGNSTSMVMFDIEGSHQPRPISALALEGTVASTIISKAQGWPIEALALEGQICSVNIKTSRPQLKPQRELIWVHGYDGERIGVID